MLPDPILITDEGDIYAGIFLCSVICVGIVGVSRLMIATAGHVVIKKIFSVFAFVGTLASWAGLAMDASKYDWWKWYDGFLFPIHVLLTPGYYKNVSAILALVIPSLLMVVCLAIACIGLFRCLYFKGVIVVSDKVDP